ncbi:MAG TPA: exodeoxyribonuclease VII small subunit [Caldithrix abyssi]|uniref:Exodeoxyribonuclease 7 small subunit n=1 Tax=Caldithrix abyssi TaxID=187145 RepID=A0A7V5RR70_CALAY|nr:exodeoxyribonuclease VII small subunit [Caldithrix abyssi]
MPAKKSFEQALKRLEEITETLEEGQASLQKSIKLYEEAYTLIDFCRGELKSAEQKIKKVTGKSDGTLKEEDFE